MRTAALPLLFAVTAVAACSSSSASGLKQPAVSAFTAGTCRVAAPDVLQIGRAASRLPAKGAPSGSVMDSLATAQGRLRQLEPGAEATYQPALSKLIVTVGLIRLSSGVGSYRPEQGATLRADYAAVVKVCTQRQ
ncbi:MAG: hypothetical protein NVS3B26_10400 [Mycobacteriales bacterium]